jgi:hypothetical protein
MITYTIELFRDISKSDLRKMKLISNKMTNESLQGFKEHRVFLVRVDTKVAAYCFISPVSPENHFGNESRAVYLYNYICDDKYKNHKVSVFLMNAIKCEYAILDINLDIAEWNIHARQFFEKNEFSHVKDYEKTFGKKEKYNSFTFFNNQIQT